MSWLNSHVPSWEHASLPCPKTTTVPSLTDPLTSRHQGTQTSSCSLLQCFAATLLLASVAIPAVAASAVTHDCIICSCSLAAAGHRAPLCITLGPVIFIIRLVWVLVLEEHAIAVRALAGKPMRSHCRDLAFPWIHDLAVATFTLGQFCDSMTL